nr:MAG TPA: hypothetical protein [Caudoviricetes sp.]
MKYKLFELGFAKTNCLMVYRDRRKLKTDIIGHVKTLIDTY